ncbi:MULTISPECIES: CDP-glycerol glycerophosphotransferase family protein [Methanobacterium]|uniref:CDP-glycerol glycerophosphotransferase family protein n=1 Tax=Methanobacterium veterum TaxID=408577 RepID=A0A9E5DIQ9_9EURY|nr:MULTISPECIES: CDP-glycerol glycerophosphotransferase family protein [Methanobacterium]MCZ3367106.1 CDP-glycerol glycerophosphotransferase family protein [Methanobacterium veterum]MCZ3373746.1 CDP-glycerol glycerophosphotransferase family protein [Methanobacterium veterum]
MDVYTMFHSFQLEKFFIEEKILTVSINGTFDYLNNSKKPKLSITFDNGAENRRLPLQVTSFYLDSGKCFIHAECEYELEYLFWRENYDCISIRFSLMYGGNYIDNLKLNFKNSILASDNIYYKVADKDEKVVILPQKSLEEHKRLNSKYGPLITIYSYLLFFMAVILIPLFALDAVLAQKGISEKSPDFKRTHNKLIAVLFHINWKIYEFSAHGLGRRRFKLWIMGRLYNLLRRRKVRENQIAFVSERREDLTGNFEFIYHKIGDDPSISIVKFLNTKPIKSLSIMEMINYVNILSTSKVILLDDFMPSIHTFDLKDDITLIQLWHAVGAFKTFGFSRIGKEGGPQQFSPNHRSYDRAIVSSKEISKFYAEGFGLSNEKVVATGVPRTDVFFDEEYRKKVESSFYMEYPHLVDKKIILFAPTFRGDGKQDAHYPMDLFNLKQIHEAIGGEYVVIVKHHPFVTEKMKIPPEYKNFIMDLSKNSEINDLLFVSDLVITDYSSVIFESSLLNVPMLFYAYDLEEYIDSRDFYYEFETFVPGKIVFNQEQVINAILNEDFEMEKISKFKNRFFDHLDGRSTERVVDMIYKILNS